MVLCGELDGGDFKMDMRTYYKQLAALISLDGVHCSAEEAEAFGAMNPEGLPSDVYENPDPAEGTRYCRYADTESDIERQLAVLNANNIKTIKNCVVFFTVLAVLGLAVGIIMGGVAAMG